MWLLSGSQRSNPPSYTPRPPGQARSWQAGSQCWPICFVSLASQLKEMAEAASAYTFQGLASKFVPFHLSSLS